MDPFALETGRDDPDASYRLGVLALKRGSVTQAVEYLARSARTRGQPHDWGDLGVALDLSGNKPQAEHAYRQALALRPDYPEAHNNLGLLLASTGRGVEALSAYRRAIAVRPDFVDAFHNLGLLYAQLERPHEAEAALRRAVALQPDHADALNSLGLVLERLGQTHEAEQTLTQLIETHPDHAIAHNNLGNLLLSRGRFAESEAELKIALYQRPDYLDAQYNMGLVLGLRQAYRESERAYRRALEIDPACHAARWNLALLLLTCGRYEEGWQLYETRYESAWAKAPVRCPAFSDGPAIAPWRGEPLHGKSLLLLPEQGYGDCIQFARYAPLLKHELEPARLTLGCPKPLVPLLDSLAGPDYIVEFSTSQTQVTRHDYWCLLGSLPWRMDTRLDTLPSATPYLRPEPDRVRQWEKELPKQGLRVGLCWKGSTSHPNDAHRSLPHLRALRMLWRTEGVHFISLQKGQAEDEAQAGLPDCPMLHLGSRIQDFGDTAAIVAQLDLVITVDTALAHVAGALGQNCWVLLPRLGTDWRWLTQRTDSPWYDSLRLFRQLEPDDWTSTIAALHVALDRWVSER